MSSPWLHVVRLMLLLLALGMVLWGYAVQRFSIHAFDHRPLREIRATEFIEGVSFDGYLRDNEAIFDIYTNSPESVQARDCHT